MHNLKETDITNNVRHRARVNQLITVFTLLGVTLSLTAVVLKLASTPLAIIAIIYLVSVLRKSLYKKIMRKHWALIIVTLFIDIFIAVLVIGEIIMHIKVYTQIMLLISIIFGVATSAIIYILVYFGYANDLEDIQIEHTPNKIFHSRAERITGFILFSILSIILSVIMSSLITNSIEHAFHILVNYRWYLATVIILSIIGVDISYDRVNLLTFMAIAEFGAFSDALVSTCRDRKFVLQYIDPEDGLISINLLNHKGNLIYKHKLRDGVKKPKIMSVSPDSRKVMIAGEGLIQVIDMFDGHEIFKDNFWEIGDVVEYWSPSSNLIIYPYCDPETGIRLFKTYNLESGRQIELDWSEDWTSAAWSDDEIACFTTIDVVSQINIYTREKKPFVTPGIESKSAKFSPERDKLAFVVDNDTIIVLPLKGKINPSTVTFKFPIERIKWSPNGELMLVQLIFENVRIPVVWKVNTHATIGTKFEQAACVSTDWMEDSRGLVSYNLISQDEISETDSGRILITMLPGL